MSDRIDKIHHVCRTLLAATHNLIHHAASLCSLLITPAKDETAIVLRVFGAALDSAKKLLRQDGVGQALDALVASATGTCSHAGTAAPSASAWTIQHATKIAGLLRVIAGLPELITRPDGLDDACLKQILDCWATVEVGLRALEPIQIEEMQAKLYRECLLAKEIKESAAEQPADVNHSSDYRMVIWFGVKYYFSPAQAACVKVLWSEWENGTPEIGKETILTDPSVESESRRLNDLFRDKKSDTGHHPAWGVMIVPGNTKGTYRLDPPKKN